MVKMFVFYKTILSKITVFIFKNWRKLYSNVNVQYVGRSKLKLVPVLKKNVEYIVSVTLCY